MKLKLAARAAITGASLCVFSLALAADTSFVGKWKFNPEKSQFKGLVYKVEDAGGGQYSLVFGDDKETMTFDGKEHTTRFGDTWSVTKTGPDTWHWVTKHGGKVVSDATWTVAKDGATSTFDSTASRPDGSTAKNMTELKRTAGDKNGGLVGTWESVKVDVGSPTTMEISKWKEDGYSIKNSTYKSEDNFKLDGKEYTPKGPRVSKGLTFSAKAMGTDKMELTYNLKGKTVETDLWEVSADGKTLTSTNSYPGQSKSQVDVYDRE